MLGNIGKDSKYLNRIKDATAHIADHPRHHGIKMQAHHLISADGVKRSGLGKELAQFGYDINLLPNLVFVPCTLQGACHLGVLPHRGNHTAIVMEDDDDAEPIDYHKMVGKRVRELERLLTDNCPADNPHRREEINKQMNKLSSLILGLIQNTPTRAPLTTIAASFSVNNEIGCGGVDSVMLHRSSSCCSVGKNHEKRQGKNQKNENIIYKKQTSFKLKVGE